MREWIGVGIAAITLAALIIGGGTWVGKSSQWQQGQTEWDHRVEAKVDRIDATVIELRERIVRLETLQEADAEKSMPTVTLFVSEPE